MDMEAFGKRLRARRAQVGWSQAAVAQHTGIIQSEVSLLERGKKRALWVDTLIRLAATLRCSLDYLAGLTDDPAPGAKPRRKRPAPAGPPPTARQHTAHAGDNSR